MKSPSNDLPRPERNLRAPSTDRRGRRDGALPQRARPTIERALFWTLATIVCGSALAVGSVHLLALIFFAGLTCLAVVFALRQQHPSTLYRFGPVVVVAGLAGYTALQSVPLPISVLAAIAPKNADIWSRALLALGEGSPTRVSISLDPGATTVEALKWLTYAGVLVAATTLAHQRGAALGVLIVFASSLVCAVTTLAHGLSGASLVFGVYKPHFPVAPWHVGPFLNPNNLAGYLNLGAMCGLGLMLMRHPPIPRWAVGIGVATIVGVAIGTASRGAVAVLPLGVLGLAALLIYGKQRSTGGYAGVSAGAIRALIVTAIGGGTFFAILAGTAAMWRELYDKNLQKLSMVLWTRPMLADFPLLGAGRGAFESVFPAYRTDSGNIVYTHAENFPAQWAAEWGLPVAAALLVGVLYLIAPRRSGFLRSSLAAGAWIGFVLLLVQNLLDLALEVPGVAVAAVTTVGSLWGDRARRGIGSRDRVGESSPRGWPLVAVVCAVVLGFAGMALTRGRHDVASDREAIHEKVASFGLRDAGARASIRGDLRAAMLRHPAEPYFPLLASLAAWSGQDANPLPGLQRSLERSAINGRAHLLLEEILAARGMKGQALLEGRLSVNDDPGLASSAAGFAFVVTHDFDQLMTAVPSGTAGPAMLDALAAQARRVGEHDSNVQFLRESIRRDQARPRPRFDLADSLVDDLQRHDSQTCPPPRRSDCLREVEVHAARLQILTPELSWGSQIRARALILEERVAEAEELLERTCPTVEDRLSCLLARVHAAAPMRNSPKFPAAAKELLGAACTSPTLCAQYSTLVGDAMVARGDHGGALTYYSRAAAEESTEWRWLNVANAAEHLGAYAQTVQALEKAAALRGGADEALRQRIDHARGMVLGLSGK